MKEGMMIKGVIQEVNDAGYGILYSNRERIQVKRVLVDEEVKVKIVKIFRGGCEAELVEVLKPSPNRIKAACGIYEKCGSCHYLHMNYPAQLNLKQSQLSELFRKTKLDMKAMKRVYGMKEPYAYRNKMIIGFAKRGKENIAGFYEEHSHRIIPYHKCLLHPPVCDEIIQTITALLKECRIEPYDEQKRMGTLRHVLIRYATNTKQIMVTLVSNEKVFKARKQFVTALTNKHPEVTTIVWNVNQRQTSVVLGNEEHVIYGKGYIEDVLCGLKFRISSKSFYQINHEQCELLYKKSVELLKLKGNEKVLDAYCGIGTIGMYASKFVKEVIGVEVNRNAVEDAIQNAKINQIKNIRFLCDDATKYLQNLSFAQRENPQASSFDAIIMDPPRDGSSVPFIKSIASLKVKKVLYISCGPQTQARDVQLLEKLGYRIKDSFGVDMFPHTYHCESVMLLEYEGSKPKPYRKDTKPSKPSTYSSKRPSRASKETKGKYSKPRK